MIYLIIEWVISYLIVLIWWAKRTGEVTLSDAIIFFIGTPLTLLPATIEMLSKGIKNPILWRRK